MYMNREEVAEPEMTRWVDRVKKPGDAFMKAAAKAQRREKKDIYAALQREQTEREAELGKFKITKNIKFQTKFQKK